MLREGDGLRIAPHHGRILPPASPNFVGGPVSAGWPLGRAVADGKSVHVHDIAAAGDEYPLAVAMSQDAIAATTSIGSSGLGVRTALAVPLMRRGAAIGIMSLSRTEVSPFTEAQIARLATFADEAAVEIENARLFGEVREAQERQPATSEILRVISQSPTDARPVFERIAKPPSTCSTAKWRSCCFARATTLSRRPHGQRKAGLPMSGARACSSIPAPIFPLARSLRRKQCICRTGR